MKKLLYCIVFIPLMVIANPKGNDKLLQESPSLAIEYIEQPFDVEKYTLDMTVSKIDTLELSGRCAAYLNWKNQDAGNKFYFHLKLLSVDSVFYNNKKVDFNQEIVYYTYHEKPDTSYPDTLFSVMPPEGTEKSGDSVVIYYHGKPGNEDGPLHFGGVIKAGGQLFANGVGLFARNVGTTSYWMPCYDHPSDKAKFEAYFHVPKGLQAVSTGKLLDIDSGGVDYDVYHWKTDIDCATYLLTFSVSDNLKYSYSLGDLPIDVYVPAVYQPATNEYPFKLLPEMVGAIEHYFLPYPFEKVGYYVSAIGSMEHQTMISMDYQVIGKSSATKDTISYTVSHELAHQWFGDMVTPLDYRDAWLNESFATFCESLWGEYKLGSTAYFSKLKTDLSTFFQQYSNGGDYRLYDFNRIVNSYNYPPTIYYKGAVVVGMLRYIMGDSLFFGGVKEFLTKHKYGNFITADLKSDLEDYSKMDLTDFFDEWIYGNVMPMIEITATGVSKWENSTDHTNNLYSIEVHSTNDEPIKQLPIEFDISTYDDKAVIKTVVYSGTDSIFTFDEPVFNVKGFGVNVGYQVVPLMRVVKQTVHFGQITDVKADKQDDLEITQNGDYLYIQSADPISAKLLDIFGNTVSITDNSDNSAIKHFYLANLSTGTYFIKIIQGDKTYLRKVNYVK